MSGFCGFVDVQGIVNSQTKGMKNFMSFCGASGCMESIVKQCGNELCNEVYCQRHQKSCCICEYCKKRACVGCVKNFSSYKYNLDKRMICPDCFHLYSKKKQENIGDIGDIMGGMGGIF